MIDAKLAECGSNRARSSRSAGRPFSDAREPEVMEFDPSLSTNLCHAVDRHAKVPATHFVEAPGRKEEGKPVARMSVYEPGNGGLGLKANLRAKKS